jgi:hypothetical protein
VEQIKEQLEQCLKDETFRSCDYNKFFYKRSFSEVELDSIFLIHKNYYENTNNLHYKILSGMKYVYDRTKNRNLKKDILYLAEKIINDTSIDYHNRGSVSASYINSKLDLSLFDKKMKKEVVKNLNFTYKKEVFKDNSNNIYMSSGSMVRLAGALEMKEAKSRLYTIADSTDSEYKKSAQAALCRMGDKRMLKDFFDELQSMNMETVVSDRWRWEYIEYIKQLECVDFLLKMLYSDERRKSSVKENIPPDKFAYYAMQVIKRISTNCPINLDKLYSYEKEEEALAKMREWAKNNKIIINRDIW